MYSMLQTKRQDVTQSPRPGGKVTDTEGDDGRRQRDERVRAKSFGPGDVTKWRSRYQKETEGGT